MEDLIVKAPHCDQRVLHAPGDCQYCDEFPAYQLARRLWGIRFTGQRELLGVDEELLPCPSEVKRDLTTIMKWPGNRPKKS